jgi:hypothetical protein
MDDQIRMFSVFQELILSDAKCCFICGIVGNVEIVLSDPLSLTSPVQQPCLLLILIQAHTSGLRIHSRDGHRPRSP